MLFRHVSVSLGFAALALISNSLVAQADTVDFASIDALEAQPAAEVEATETQPELAIAPIQPEQLEQPVQPVQPLAVDSETPAASDAEPDLTAEASTFQLTDIQDLSSLTATPNAEATEYASEEYVEGGSTVSTSAAALTDQPTWVESQAIEGQEAVEPATEQVAQAVTPGTATRSGSSYIGVGGNIGLGDGDTALGDGSFAIFSKIGLTDIISVRPAVLFSDDPTILIPVTFDFIPGVTGVTEDLSGRLGLRISPYIGGGVAISTGGGDAFDFLLSGGVDVPLTPQFTATAAVNATLFNNTAVGLLLGLGYNFTGF